MQSPSEPPADRPAAAGSEMARPTPSGLMVLLWATLAAALFVWGIVAGYRFPITWAPHIDAVVENGSSRLTLTVRGAVEQPSVGADAAAPNGTKGPSDERRTARAPGPRDAGSAEALQPSVPVAHAEATLFSEVDEGHWVEVAKTTLDDVGRGSFEQLPSGAAWVVVRAPGYARVSRRLVLYDQQAVQLELPRARELVVKVQDEEGEPIRDATVLVRAQDELPFGQLTDENGVARLSGLASGPYGLQVFAKGYSTATRDRVTRDERVVLTRLGSLFVRTVAQNGDPVANAEVRVVGTRLWPARRVTTDEQGRVVIAGLPEGLYDLRAERQQLVSPILSNLQLERGQRRDVELRMLPGRMLQVQVRSSDEEALPIADARLVLAENGLSAFPMTAVANDRGQATLGPMPVGPAFLSARADGYIGRGALPVPEAGPMTVKLLRGGTVRGEVVDVDDRPIRDARIEVVGLDLDGLPIAESPLSAAYREAHFDFAMRPLSLVQAGELGVTYGPVPFVNMVLDNPDTVSDFTALPEDYAPWSTNLEGRFRAFPVPPGRIRLIVRHHQYAEGQSRIFTMGPGGNVKVKVVLDEGNVLRGRVVDENDRPVSEARVLVTGVQNGFERTAMVKPDGTFRMRGVPREVNVSLARPDEPTRFVRRSRATLKPGSDDEVQFVLPNVRDTLQWTVYDDLGKPVELAQVAVQSVDPLVPLRMTQFSDAEGRVSFADAAGLALRVVVEAPGFIPAIEQVSSAPTDKQFSLLHGVTVTGRVTAVRGRAAVGGAQVVLEGGTRRTSTVTSALGEYEFANVAPGKVQLRVTHDSYANARRDLVVERTGFDNRSFEVADIDLEDAVSVRGHVVDAQGRAVVAARVSSEPLPEFRPKGALGDNTVLTDDDGAFVLRGLEPGDQTVYAQSAVAGTGSARVSLRDGDATGDLVVRLVAPLQADDAEFSSSTGSVAISFEQRGARVVITQVPANGEAERAGLLEGDVIISIDGTPPHTVASTRTLLRGPISGDVVVSVSRQDTTHTFRVRREQVSK